MSVNTRQFGGSHGSGIQGWGHQEEEAKEQTGQTGVGHPRTDAEVTRGGGEPVAWH